MAAKLKVVPKDAKPVVEDEDDHECPKCPPVGAPAWMATFADMATLLMAFFVLILAFANFDEVSFKKMAGSMRDAFGVQLVVPLENPISSTILEMDFRPQHSDPKDIDSPDPETGTPDEGKGQSESDNPLDAASKAMAQAIRQAMADGELSVETDNGKVTIKLPPGAGKEEAEELAQAIARVAGTEPDLAESVASTVGGGREVAETSGASQVDEAGDGAAGKSEDYRAGIADARLQVALRQEIAQGLVAVERKDDKVFITIGAGGAFPSGSAELTDSAVAIMARLGAAAEGKNARITVTGHTDNVPISGGRFQDNWDLAGARASSVVRALGNTGSFDPSRLTAVSQGDSNPVASNDTEAGREQNRRIEIEMSFDDVGQN